MCTIDYTKTTTLYDIEIDLLEELAILKAWADAPRWYWFEHEWVANEGKQNTINSRLKVIRSKIVMYSIYCTNEGYEV